MAVRFGNGTTNLYTTTAGLPTGDFTFLLWMNVTAISGSNWSGLLHFTASTGMQVEASPGTTDYGFGADPTDGPTFTATIGAWHCLVGTRSGTSHVLRHGTSASSLTTLSGVTSGVSTPSVLNLGAYGAGEDSFNGRMANFKLYNAVLTTAEMTQELSQYVPQRTTNLTHWYPFINVDTTDYSGNARTLTAVDSGHALADGPSVRWSRPRPRYVNFAGISADYALVATSAQSASTSVLANADCANVAITGYDPISSLRGSGDAAALSVDGQQALGNVGGPADVASLAATAQQATRGNPTSPTADVASISMPGQDAKPTLASVSDYSFFGVETINASPPAPPSTVPVPSTTLVPSTSLVPGSVGISYSALDITAQTALILISVVAGVATVALVAGDARPEIGGMADVALIALNAQDSFAGQPTLAPAGAATLSVTSQDAKTLVLPTADAASLLLEALLASTVPQAPVPSGSLVPSTSLVPNSSGFFVFAPAGAATLSVTSQQVSPLSSPTPGAAAITALGGDSTTPTVGQARADVATVSMTARDAAGAFVGRGFSPTVVFNPKNRFGVPLRGYRRA